MKLIKADNNRGWLAPWATFPSIFDDDFFTDSISNSGLDMWEDSDKVYVNVAVPGISEKDLDVNLENGVLTVRAAKEEVDEKESKGKKIYSSTMKKSFYYSTSLPGNLDLSSVDANLENGVLKVEIKKAEESKPTKIEVKKKS